MWLGVALATFGLYNLCATGTESFSINPGDIMVIAGAAFGALHMLLISKYVKFINGMHLICIEFYIASIYCAVFALILEKPVWSDILTCGPEILYASVLGSGICYMFQVTAQKHTDPTIAALLMSLESVELRRSHSAETFTFKEILGSACVFASGDGTAQARLGDNPQTRRKNGTVSSRICRIRFLRTVRRQNKGQSVTSEESAESGSVES
ncbi:MAG: DMT family transporter [Anaerovoracaceae bacterium]